MSQLDPDLWEQANLPQPRPAPPLDPDLWDQAGSGTWSDPPPPSGGGGGGGGGGAGPKYAKKSQSVANGVSAPPDIFSEFSGYAVDEAKTDVKNIMSWMGFPTNMDSNQIALWILQSNLQANKGDLLERFYWSSFMDDEKRKDNPWVRYGMDADQFKSAEFNASSILKNLTGEDVTMGEGWKGGTPLSNLLQDAIKNGWSQAQIMGILQSGEFVDLSGNKADLSKVTESSPWLASGQTYQAEVQQYSSVYGAPPPSKEALAGWYRFNRGTSTLGPWYSQKLSEQAATGKNIVQTEVR